MTIISKCDAIAQKPLLTNIVRVLVVYGAKDNEFRTARTYPKMVFIDVSVHDENHFAIDAPTMRTLYVKIPSRYVCAT